MKKRNELKVNNDYYLQNEIIEIDNYCDKKGILDNQKKRMATLAAYLMKHNENESDNTIDNVDLVYDLKLAKEFLKDEIIFVDEMKRDFNVEALKTYFSGIVND